MRVLVTGSRNWKDYQRLCDALDSTYKALAEQFPDKFRRDGFILVSGHAQRGVDRMAEAWYTAQFPLETPELWPANWKKHGKRAGFKRNHEMVDTKPDLCVAFIAPCEKAGCPTPQPHGSHGATDCWTYAIRQGVQTSLYYEGSLQGLSHDIGA